MSFSKFRVKDTGVEFLYNNKDNTIYDKNFTRLPIQKLHTHTLEGSWSKTKLDKPKHIRISLGQKCNYKCSYCMQEDLAGMHEIENANIEKFLSSITKLDLSELERVELWGGEVFMYWNIVKEIMGTKELDKEGLIWYVPTNGSMLAEKHVDFFDGLKSTIQFGISHDGPKQEEVRGKCPLKRLGPVLHRIDLHPERYGYSFNVTLSHNNFDVPRIDRYFWDYAEKYHLKNMSLNYSPVESYDLLSYVQTIHGEHLEEYREKLKIFLDKQLEYFKTKTNTRKLRNDLFLTGTNGVIKFAESIKGSAQNQLGSRCGADWNQLISVDTEGNVLSCPHVSSDTHKCGTIDKIKDAEMVKMTYDRSHNGNDDSCSNCQVLLLCNKGCPLDLTDTYRERSCNVLKAHYIEVQLAAFKLLFDSEIEYLGKENAININN